MLGAQLPSREPGTDPLSFQNPRLTPSSVSDILAGRVRHKGGHTPEIRAGHWLSRDLKPGLLCSVLTAPMPTPREPQTCILWACGVLVGSKETHHVTDKEGLQRSLWGCSSSFVVASCLLPRVLDRPQAEKQKEAR